MTTSQFISHIVASCTEIYNLRESQSIAYALAKALLGETKIDIILNPNKRIDSSLDVEDISRRLVSGEPMQYIVGCTEFCDMEFEVGRGVLIPRPETEELISWIVGSCDVESDIRILDIGTGSGCIAISLASKLPNSEVFAIDLERDAIYWAERNVINNKISNVTILQQDALLPVASWSDAITSRDIDVVVSNPPYIPQRDIESMDLNVKGYEPHSALFVPDNDPLLFYKAIALSAMSLLKIGGELYFEIYESFASQMETMLSELGYSDIEIKEDINSKPRMCRCMKR